MSQSPYGVPDLTAALDGSIPWSAEEYLVVLAEQERLEAADPATWDLRPRTIPAPDPAAAPIAFNVALPANQLGLFMAGRYAAQGPTAIMSHITRFFAMSAWLAAHHGRLRADGWLAPAAGHDADAVAVSAVLLEALATLPYGAPGGTFAYDAVVTRAIALHEARGH